MQRINVFQSREGNTYSAQRWQNYGKSRIYVYKNDKDFGYFENGVLHGKAGGKLKGSYFGENEMSYADFLARFELLEVAVIPTVHHKPEQQMVYESVLQERFGMAEDNDLDEQFWKRDA